jgi:hypothetical protein
MCIDPCFKAGIGMSAVRVLRNEADKSKELLTEAAWRNYEVWKSVTASLQRGIRDQSSDFNKWKAEVTVCCVLSWRHVPVSLTFACASHCRCCQHRGHCLWTAEFQMRSLLSQRLRTLRKKMLCAKCVLMVNHSKQTQSFSVIDATLLSTRCGTACGRCCPGVVILHMHLVTPQKCYGISTIPEGDFFCDRCKYLKFSSSSAQVVCRLCPIAEGAFKKTVDHQWVRWAVQVTVLVLAVDVCFICALTQVHIVCALWHPRSVITDVACMGPVDISGVLGGTACVRYFSGPSSTLELRSFLSASAPSNAAEVPSVAELAVCPAPHTVSAPNTMCLECKSDYGATLKCAAPECAARFHPLCAWYAGFYVRCTIDPSCCLLYNENPDERGLLIAVYCPSHVPVDVLAVGRSTVAQRQLRCKYRAREVDVSDVSRRCRAVLH